jgi:hypothetical protein
LDIKYLSGEVYPVPQHPAVLRRRLPRRALACDDDDVVFLYKLKTIVLKNL